MGVKRGVKFLLPSSFTLKAKHLSFFNNQIKAQLIFLISTGHQIYMRLFTVKQFPKQAYRHPSFLIDTAIFRTPTANLNYPVVRQKMALCMNKCR